VEKSLFTIIGRYVSQEGSESKSVLVNRETSSGFQGWNLPHWRPVSSYYVSVINTLMLFEQSAASCV